MSQTFYIKNNTKFGKTDIRIKYKLYDEFTIFITSQNLKQDIRNISLEKDINNIRLTNDYKLKDLSFLSQHDFSFIAKLDILSDFVNDVSDIYFLENLEIINSRNQKIDYTNFKYLKDISGELSIYSYKTLHEVNGLINISISNKFKETDLSIFSANKLLRKITMRGSKLISLMGLENFKYLECLELFHNRNITSLEGITDNHKNLKEISIYSAPKLFNVNDYLSKLINLEHLQLACKKVDSLKFLDELKNLKFVSIHNKLIEVEDGDKEPLLRALKRTNGKIW